MISFGQRTQLPSWVRYPKREKLLFCFWDSNFVQKNPGPLTISTFHVCFLFRNSFSIEKCSWKFFRDKINQGITASFPPFFSFWRKKFKKVTGKIIHVKRVKGSVKLLILIYQMILYLFCYNILKLISCVKSKFPYNEDEKQQLRSNQKHYLPKMPIILNWS